MHFVLELAYFREAVKGEVSGVVVGYSDVVFAEGLGTRSEPADTAWIAPLIAVAFTSWVVACGFETISCDDRVDGGAVISVWVSGVLVVARLVASLICWGLKNGQKVASCVLVRLSIWPHVRALHNLDLSILSIAVLICVLEIPDTREALSAAPRALIRSHDRAVHNFALSILPIAVLIC